MSIATDPTPRFEVRQQRAGSTFYVYLPLTKQEHWPPKGTYWSQKDAKREGDRLIAQPSDRAVCPICKKFIGGELVRCTCPLNQYDGMEPGDLIAAGRKLLGAAETRMRNVAGTAMLDKLERKDLTFAREDVRSVQVVLGELEARIDALTAALHAAEAGAARGRVG